MEVHHINCGAMQPFGGGLFDGQSPIAGPAEMSCHCLLLETDAGLVLVDTGTVSDDPQRDEAVNSPVILALDRPRLNRSEAAASQVRRMGHQPNDVSHIVMTHMDFDHAAGLQDFPQARIHLSAVEAEAARDPRTPKARGRYRSGQWASTQSRWHTYANFGADWFGIPATAVEGLPGIMLVSLPGHTKGHCGVAIQRDGGWLLHAGDAILNHGEIAPEPRMPTGARLFQWTMETSQTQRRRSLAKLRTLKRQQGSEVEVICTHDPALMQQALAALNSRRT